MPDVALQEKVALSEGTPTARQAACWKLATAVQYLSSLLRMPCPISPALAVASTQARISCRRQ